jgi:hypothetical protein
VRKFKDGDRVIAADASPLRKAKRLGVVGTVVWESPFVVNVLWDGTKQAQQISPDFLERFGAGASEGPAPASSTRGLLSQ